jgi:hypothetical protein
VAAAVGGLIIAAILAVLAIRYLVDQVVAGIVLNVFALGLTGFLYEQIMTKDQTGYNQPTRVPTWTSPVLSDIPLLGPVLFKANVFVYGALLLVAVVHFGLTRTRWGLRTRAVGEHPTAADTVGVKVLGLRYRNCLVAGLVAGFGGAYFTLLSTTNFNKGMTNGAGFIALAALILVGGARSERCSRRCSSGSPTPSPSIWRHREPHPEPVPEHAAVRGDDRRRGRSRGPRASTGGRRQAVHQGVSEPRWQRWTGPPCARRQPRLWSTPTRRTPGFPSGQPAWSTTAGSWSGATWRTPPTG